MHSCIHDYLVISFNHSLDDGTIGLSDVGVSMLGDKVDISSVMVDTSIVVCTFVPVECDTVGCSAMTICIKYSYMDS